MTLDRDPFAAPSGAGADTRSTLASDTAPTLASDTSPDRGGRRGASLRVVAAAAVLSATLACGGTAALLLASLPGAAPAATPAASPATAATSSPASASVAAAGAGEAIANVAAAAGQSVVTISSTSGVGPGGSIGGTGIVVSADGLILTTTVAAAGATTYDVLLPDLHQTTARVVATDAAHGLVLLRADATGLTPARLASSDHLLVGQAVVAVGSPLGEFTDTVTSGIVSALDRKIDVRDPSSGRRVALGGLIQTDAAINAGSSGGPVLDLSGAVVAVIATSASSGQGIGFAIPISAALQLISGAK